MIIHLLSVGITVNGKFDVVPIGSFSDEEKLGNFMSWINENYPDDFDGMSFHSETVDEIDYFEEVITDLVNDLRQGNYS